jgi:predicted alpha/beta hydrolase family esterase
MRICIIPRWSANPDDDWYPWLARALPAHQVVVPSLRPNPGAPEIEACVTAVADTLGREWHALAATWLVGHSVGCQVALRFLESLPDTFRVAGVLCVAGWWAAEAPSLAMQPWLDTPLDTALVRRAAGSISVLLSHGDPFSPDQDDNAAQWEERLGAQVTFVPGAGHFRRTREPAVLEALADALL